MPDADVPCDARVADGAIRGAFMGVVWAAWFGPSDMHREVLLRGASRLRWALVAARYTSMSVAGFSGFFGMYNGFLCQAERQFGSRSLAAPTIVGGALGAAIGASIRPLNMLNVATVGSLCATVSMAVSASMAMARADTAHLDCSARPCLARDRHHADVERCASVESARGGAPAGDCSLTAARVERLTSSAPCPEPATARREPRVSPQERRHGEA